MNCNKIIHDKNCNTIIQENNYDSSYAFVYVLLLNTTKGVTSQVFIKTSEELEVVFTLGLDGFYTLMTLKVPTGEGSEYYYKNDKFYHFYNEIDLLKLIELNPNVTGIEVTFDYYFLTCRLKNCFIDICYLIFDSKTSIDCSNLPLDKNLVYKRDLIWSALNVIKYLVEKDQYEEAERLLEKIIGCNGLCTNVCIEHQGGCGCK